MKQILALEVCSWTPYSGNQISDGLVVILLNEHLWRGWKVIIEGIETEFNILCQCMPKSVKDENGNKINLGWWYVLEFKDLDLKLLDELSKSKETPVQILNHLQQNNRTLCKDFQ